MRGAWFLGSLNTNRQPGAHLPAPGEGRKWILIPIVKLLSFPSFIVDIGVGFATCFLICHIRCVANWLWFKIRKLFCDYMWLCYQLIFVCLYRGKVVNFCDTTAQYVELKVFESKSLDHLRFSLSQINFHSIASWKWIGFPYNFIGRVVSKSEYC